MTKTPLEGHPMKPSREQQQHTPGPWRLKSDPFEDEEPYFTFNAGVGNWPEGFHLSGILGEADARLIAAAPELLEALEAEVADLEAIYDACKSKNLFEVTIGMFRRLNAARAAIAKARGKQS